MLVPLADRGSADGRALFIGTVLGTAEKVAGDGPNPGANECAFAAIFLAANDRAGDSAEGAARYGSGSRVVVIVVWRRLIVVLADDAVSLDQ